MPPERRPGMSHLSLEEMRSGFLGIADATFEFQRNLKRRLREIDRKALNAQVLVRRHGQELAGYGVVARSFRDGAQRLQQAAMQLQHAIHPLMLGFMETLRDSHQAEQLQRLSVAVRERAPQLNETLRRHQHMLEMRSDQSRHATLRLSHMLKRVEHIVTELEYVVINGRIEAALKTDVRTALTQVSADMNKAVIQVRQLLREYAASIGRVLP